MKIPKVYKAFQQNWVREREELMRLYAESRYSFIPCLLPADAVRLSANEVFELLQRRFGTRLYDAIDLAQAPIRSPVAHEPNGDWLKKANMVGINVRTVGNFWNVVKYCLTLPQSQNAVHLLPIWETGVVSSLYGMSGWGINPEFFSESLRSVLPHLDTPAKQLKVVVNILHLMGKTVGMDVIPHTDRYSEMVLANPRFFEWLQREDFEIVSHRAHLHEEVESCIWGFLSQHRGALSNVPLPTNAHSFFYETEEVIRLQLLFGDAEDVAWRNRRRNLLVRHLYENGFETVPATMGPPYRGIRVSLKESEKTTDAEGRVWRDYVIEKPQTMSRVFGPLARYKFYERLADNENWEIDFSKPRTEVWNYFCEQYGKVQSAFGFDFMRGDMSHVQMRREGVPAEAGDYYDPLRSVKRWVGQRVPHFGYFAETFLAPPDEMAYGNELDHLELSEADTTLGDLQSVAMTDPLFFQRFRFYHDALKTRTCAPNFTVITADKDDPRFDAFYLQGNAARLFIALFLTDMPSYMGLGFETRNLHHQPAPNEHYTKLFVFQISEGAKATKGSFIWGNNGSLFHDLTQIRLTADELLAKMSNKDCRWILPPDPTAGQKVIAWTTQDHEPQWVFVVNLDMNNDISRVKLPFILPAKANYDWMVYFSINEQQNKLENPIFNGKSWDIGTLKKGCCIIFEIKKQ